MFQNNDFFSLNSVERFSKVRTAEVLVPVSRQQRGRVKFQGTEWFASFEQDSPVENICASANAKVNVVGRSGIVLLIEPLTSSTRDM